MGLSQADLAVRAGLSQGYVSLLERGQAASPEALDALARALGLEEVAPRGRSDDPALLLSGPRVPPPSSPGARLRVDTWAHPPDGGDIIMVCSAGSRATLLVALDVAGHGRSKRAVATWLAGWIRGRLAGTPGVPRLIELWAGLHHELNEIQEGAAFFLATLERWSDSHHIRYEGLTDGYPPPLLLVGHRPRALESCGHPVPTASGRSEPQTVVHGDLRPPWRLAIASDGLLYRTGGGEESAGLRWIRRWQTGSDRELPLRTKLESAVDIADDESMAVISWDDWDIDTPFDPTDRASQTRLQAGVQALASAFPQERKEELAQALCEVLSNVARYAPAAPARFRARRLDDGVLTVQVQDKGQGPGAIREAAGISMVKELVNYLDFAENSGSGTTVTFEMGPGGKEA